MDPIGPDPEIDLSVTERRLARLRPSPVALDRDRLMFEAGRASALAGPRSRLAPALAAALALVAVGLGGLLARERSGRLAPERTLAARAPEAGPLPRPREPAPPLDPGSYLALGRRFLAEGLDRSPPQSPRRAAGPPLEATPTDLAPLRVRGPGGRVEL